MAVLSEANLIPDYSVPEMPLECESDEPEIHEHRDHLYTDPRLAPCAVARKFFKNEWQNNDEARKAMDKEWNKLMSLKRPNPKDSLVCMSRELDGGGVTEGAVFRGSIGRMVARIKQGTIHKGVIVRLHLSENEVRLSLGYALDNIVEQRTLFLEAVRVGQPGIFEKAL